MGMSPCVYYNLYVKGEMCGHVGVRAWGGGGGGGGLLCVSRKGGRVMWSV